MKTSRIELRRLAGTPDEVRELQRVLEEAPGYALRISGEPVSADAAESTLSALPPGKTLDHKYVFGIFEARRMIGCADLIRGYPDDETAMLGLLLLSETAHGRGVGKLAYESVEEICKAWPEIRQMRLSVVRTNDQVLPFWEKMGFADTGLRKPFESDEVVSESLVLVKPLAPVDSSGSTRFSGLEY